MEEKLNPRLGVVKEGGLLNNPVETVEGAPNEGRVEVVDPNRFGVVVVVLPNRFVEGVDKKELLGAVVDGALEKENGAVVEVPVVDGCENEKEVEVEGVGVDPNPVAKLKPGAVEAGCPKVVEVAGCPNVEVVDVPKGAVVEVPKVEGVDVPKVEGVVEPKVEVEVEGVLPNGVDPKRELPVEGVVENPPNPVDGVDVVLG